MYCLNVTPSYSTSIYAPPVSSAFTSSALYSLPNASFNDSNTLSNPTKYFSTFSAVISLLLKYITLSLLPYLNVNIPFPFLSVVYFKLLIPSNFCKFSILFAIAFNPVVSLMLPSLPNMYCLNVTPLYSTSIYTPPVLSCFMSSIVYFVPNASFTALNTFSTVS